jgi:hypothetical protein
MNNKERTELWEEYIRLLTKVPGKKNDLLNFINKKLFDKQVKVTQYRSTDGAA